MDEIISTVMFLLGSLSKFFLPKVIFIPNPDTQNANHVRTGVNYFTCLVLSSQSTSSFLF